MVHKDDKEASVNAEQDKLLKEAVAKHELKTHFGKEAWQRMQRLERQTLLRAAYRAEQALSIQLLDAQRTLEDLSEIRRALPGLRGEVLKEAKGILSSNEKDQALLNVKDAFDAAREAWLQTPAFIRHQSRDRKLKKQAIKLMKELS